MSELSPEILEECEKLILTNEKIREIQKLFLEELNRGLCKETNAEADMKCYITYVQSLPDQTEIGTYLALDLGGTSFRVHLIKLKDGHDVDMISKSYIVSSELKKGSGEQLFDHIAECLANFIQQHDLEKEILPLGFTFSFPVIQSNIRNGVLQRWSKGYNCSGVVGKDVVPLLQKAIERRKDIRVKICALLNDTTGTLMSSAWLDPDCRIGLILGTGTNACYVEKVKNAQMFDLPGNKRNHVVINTEWGAFGENGTLDCIRTNFDREVDQKSTNPGKQIFEKMISGMYLGELVRIVVVRIMEKGLFAHSQETELLQKPWSFKSEYISQIESDTGNSYQNCQRALEKFGLRYVSRKDCETVRYICERVSTRAADLASIGIAVLINKIDEPKVTVAIDGSLYRYHPYLHSLMMKRLADLVKPSIKYELMLSGDGSGRGAALVAAAECGGNLSRQATASMEQLKITK